MSEPFEPKSLRDAFDQLAKRFVRAGKVLACEEHEQAASFVVEALKSYREIDADLSRGIDDVLRCEHCERLATAELQVEVQRDDSHLDRVAARAISKLRATIQRDLANAGSESQLLTFEPILLPKGPFCPAPVHFAKARPARHIAFGAIKDWSLSQGIPKTASIKGGKCPIAVTTALLAQMAVATGHWRIALPLAPQRTRIVTYRGSPLLGGRRGAVNTAQSLRLAGSVVAVTDRTSSYASRLVLMARQSGLVEEFIDAPPEFPKFKRDVNKLRLFVSKPEEMVKLLKAKQIDGFAAVEPFPTVARRRLGIDDYAEIRIDDQCTSASTGFCCVVIVPALLTTSQYEKEYDELLEVLIRSLLGLLHREAVNSTEALFTQILSGISGSIDLQNTAREATCMALKHFTDYYTPGMTAEQLIDSLVPRVNVEASHADAEALAPHLPEHYKKLIRKRAQMTDANENVYDFSRAREVATRVLSSSQLEIVVQEVKRQNEDLAEMSKTVMPPPDWDKNLSATGPTH